MCMMKRVTDTSRDSGLWCASLGYGNEELIDAINQQLKTLPYSQLFGGRTHQRAIDLADELASMVPVDDARIFSQIQEVKLTTRT